MKNRLRNPECTKTRPDAYSVFEEPSNSCIGEFGTVSISSWITYGGALNGQRGGFENLAF